MTDGLMADEPTRDPQTHPYPETPTATLTEPETDSQPDGLTARLPGFARAIVRPNLRTNPDAPTAPPGTAGETPDGAAAAADGQSSGTRTSTPAFFKQRAKAYESIAAELFRAVGGLANMRLAAHDNDDSWLPNDDDLETVAPPLGRIGARRLNIGDESNLADVADLGQLVVGLVAYTARNLASSLTAWRDRRRATRGIAVHQGDDAAG